MCLPPLQFPFSMLGRAPLMEASANRPMTLTNAGFVALPE